MSSSVEIVFCDALKKNAHDTCLKILNGSYPNVGKCNMEEKLLLYFKTLEEKEESSSSYKSMFDKHFEKTKEGFWVLKSTFYYGLGIH